MESYRTIAAKAEARLVEKKSEFIGWACPVQTEEQAIGFLQEIRTLHRTASHNVYAYILREDSRKRYSDDGEPAKTAGLPVLSVLEHADITDCIIVVTRYFGGTLLGTGGLVRAYTAAAKAALEAAEIATVRLCTKLELTVPYPLYETAQRLLEASGAVTGEPQFTDRVLLTATLPAEHKPGLETAINEMLRGEGTSASVWSEPFFIPFAETPAQ